MHVRKMYGCVREMRVIGASERNVARVVGVRPGLSLSCWVYFWVLLNICLIFWEGILSACAACEKSSFNEPTNWRPGE